MSRGEPEIATAAREGDTEKLQRLIDSGESVNQKGQHGLTPLMHASRTDKGKGSECVKILLDNGADVHIRNDNGYTAFTCASCNGRYECVKLLLNAGADVNDRNNGRTALHLAAEQGDLTCMNILIEYGANINERDDEGQSALHHLANHWTKDSNRIQCAVLLLENGADVNIRDRNRETVLHLSAYWGNLELSKIFLAHGANATLENKYGKAALQIADDEIKHDLRTLINKSLASTQVNNTQRHNEIELKLYAQEVKNENKVNNLEKKMEKMQEKYEEQIDNLNKRLSSLEMNKGKGVNKAWLAKSDEQLLIKIEGKSTDIASRMHPKPVIDWLWSKQAITEEQYQDLTETTKYETDISKGRYLLRLINNGPDYLNALKKALVCTNQQHVAELLINSS